MVAIATRALGFLDKLSCSSALVPHTVYGHDE